MQVYWSCEPIWHSSLVFSPFRTFVHLLINWRSRVQVPHPRLPSSEHLLFQPFTDRFSWRGEYSWNTQVVLTFLAFFAYNVFHTSFTQIDKAKLYNFSLFLECLNGKIKEYEGLVKFRESDWSFKLDGRQNRLRFEQKRFLLFSDFLFTSPPRQ